VLRLQYVIVKQRNIQWAHNVTSATMVIGVEMITDTLEIFKNNYHFFCAYIEILLSKQFWFVFDLCCSSTARRRWEVSFFSCHSKTGRFQVVYLPIVRQVKYFISLLSAQFHNVMLVQTSKETRPALVFREFATYYSV